MSQCSAQSEKKLDAIDVNRTNNERHYNKGKGIVSLLELVKRSNFSDSSAYKCRRAAKAS